MSDNPNPVAATQPKPRSQRAKYIPAVGPRLRILLWFVLALIGLLGANSIYLSSITFMEFTQGETYQDQFYMYMFLVHLALGVLLVLPFLSFGIIHMVKSWRRKNKRAIRVGYVLFASAVTVIVTGILLVQIQGMFELRSPFVRSVVYWAHIISPLICVWFYWLHRLVGRKIQWKMGLGLACGVGVVVLGLVVFQLQEPQKWGRVGSVDGPDYFHPSKVRTSDNKFISKRALMNDDYCKRCHKDVYEGWFHSAHRFSSFNNPAYLASITETRKVSMERTGTVKASRWCAGCHDPVPFLSGEFDDPDYDILTSETAHAGITCTVCHSITHVNSNQGNADFTIEEPQHYPFTYSKNKLLQFINESLVKAKPSFHKKSMLKPFHKTAEFCSTCHKVHLPKELTNYKEFLRGQNHFDAWLLSGVSGEGARSFYYPPKAQKNCNGCHMPLKPSNDFGADFFAGSDQLMIHDHTFVGANLAIGWFMNDEKSIMDHRKFLNETVRVDIFGIKRDGKIDGELIAPLRPDVPTLKPGGSYLLETVVRTLKLGHVFTQGTADSNEIWLEVEVESGGKSLWHSGRQDELGHVDPYAHRLNVFMLDRNGNRINRRNAQDIFVPLYNHQIPPGAGQSVHYALNIPKDVSAPVKVTVRLNYRKFDTEYMQIIAKEARPGGKPIRGYVEGKPYKNELPIVVMAEDSVTFPVEGIAEKVTNAKSKIVPWQRWNDYGIGLFLKGKGELKQAAEAFRKVEELGLYHGPLNLARVHYEEGELDKAVEMINKASSYKEPAAPSWTLAWLSGRVNREQGYLAEAEKNFQSVIDTTIPDRGFAFKRDYMVNNLLGMTIFDQSKGLAAADQKKLLERARDVFLDTLEVDSENVAAHYNLQQIYSRLGDSEKAAEHRVLHERYKADDNARDEAIRQAREKYPAANKAAEAVVIYELHSADEKPLKAKQETAGDTNNE